MADENIAFLCRRSPAVSLILVRRIAVSLLLLTAGMVTVQPSAGQSGTWTATGSLNTARDEHTAILLPNGMVLVAGGYRVLQIASAELYDSASGTWSVTGSLNKGRYGHTATLLPNGMVLVAGGFNSYPSMYAHASAELYDPASGTWSVTGSLDTARSGHTATLLPNGKVLIAGGVNYVGSFNPLASSELYDPGSGTWSAAGSLTTARFRHTATLLPDGKVLVAGGFDSAGFNGGASAELYDPALGTWSATGSLNAARSDHTATLLPNGMVLVAGGLDNSSGNASANAELYDQALGTWSATGSLNAARYDHMASLLPNGKVLVAGGYKFNPGYILASAELYDPASGIWNVTGSLNTARGNPRATLLPNGMVLEAGGVGSDYNVSASAELYIESSSTSPALLNISTRARVLTEDQVLIGGFIITGTDLKKVLIRGMGPSLIGLAGTLSDPTLELHQGSTTVSTNDNWKVNEQTQQSQEADIEATTIPPINDLESAILATLSPGAYTAILAGKNGGTGIGLVEIYDLDTAADSKLANITTRGLVQTGDNVMIGGFILSAGSAEVIVRAIGPSLTSFGVAGALQDPTLELHDANGVLIQSNDNWRSDQEAEIVTTNLPPSNDLESAIVSTLTSGAYTAIVRGKNDTTGVGLVEVYQIN